MHFLKKWFGIKKPVLQPRLTRAEVLDIAHQAVAQYSERDHLCVAELEDKGGKLIWFVGTHLRGSTVELLIDDLSGDVVRLTYLSSR